MTTTYKFKKRPYAHQVAALKKLMDNIANGVYAGALLMEPRTGKTKVAVDFASMLHQAGKVNRVLVFCPVGVMGVWEEQIHDNCRFRRRVTIWDRQARKDVPLPSFGKDVLDFVVMNYDALSTPGRVRGKDKHGAILRSKSRGGRYDIKRQIKAWKPDLIILDESHRIKTPSAKKTFAILSLRDIPAYKLIMTGTIVTKSKRLFDVYTQYKFINDNRFIDENTGKQMTFGTFKSRYGRWVDRGQWSKYLGPQNLEDLHAKVHMDAFSITRDECYDLPKMTPQIIHVDLEESAAVYDQMAEDMVARIHTGEITEASIQLVQRLRLQQITSGLGRTSPTLEHPEGRIVIIGSEKLRMLQSRLEDLMEADEKVVIGALFKPDLQRIEAMVRKLKVPIFVVKGGVKNADREYARTQFPKVDGGAVFLGQPAAAGEGIDLSCASIMQWYSLTPSWVNYRQFSDRIALSDKPTFHEYFLARGTVDELLYDVLQEDGDIGKAMITSPERLLRLRDSGS